MFYTNNSHDLHFDLFDNISDLDIPVQFLKCMSGSSNALDFQLSSYLGHLISINPKEHYYIVSNDMGYDAVVAFWQNRKIPILRLMCSIPNNRDSSREIISGKSGVTAVRADVLDKFKDLRFVKSEFEKRLPERYLPELDELMQIFEHVLANSRKNYMAVSFRNALTKRYGLANGSEIYNILKDFVPGLFKALQDVKPENSKPVASAKSGRIKPTCDAGAGVGVESHALSKPVCYTWVEFKAHVDTYNVCTAYRRSLVHDFKFIDDNLGLEILAIMAYAVMWVKRPARIDAVMRVLKPKLPSNISLKDITSLRNRLSKKMSGGVWPAELETNLLSVSDPPFGF